MFLSQLVDYKDYGNMVASLLRNESPLRPSPNAFLSLFHIRLVSRMRWASAAILNFSHTLPLAEQVLLMRSVAMAIQSAKQQKNPFVTERINQFKRMLQADRYSNWRNALLAVDIQPVHDFSFINLPTDQRFLSQHCHVGDIESHVVMGSTYVTNKAPVFGTEAHILDALHVASVGQSGANSVQDIIFALGDGCGGHFGDTKQDKQISRAAHFAAKYAVRFMATYNDPDRLRRELPQLITLIDEDVRLKLQDGREGSTLLAGRRFAQPNSYRLIGFNIGDGMLAQWNAAKMQFETLSPACVWTSSLNAQQGTAVFPYAYRAADISYFDCDVPKGSILFVMSDGAYESLPITHAVLDNHYQSTALCSEALTKIFQEGNVEITATHSVGVLKNLADQRLNAKRQMQVSRLEQTLIELNQKKLEIEDQHAPRWRAQQQAINVRWNKLSLLSGVPSESALAQLRREEKELKNEIRDTLDVVGALQSASTIQLGDDFTLCGLHFK